LADIPDIDEIEEPESTLVIFDDLLAERNLKQVEDYFLRGRNKGISMIFIAQKALGKSGIPLMIRSNSDYIFVKKFTSIKDAQRLFSEYDVPDNIMDLYRKATAKNEDFLLIDLITGDDKLKVRHNFG